MLREVAAASGCPGLASEASLEDILSPRDLELRSPLGGRCDRPDARTPRHVRFCGQVVARTICAAFRRPIGRTTSCRVRNCPNHTQGSRPRGCGAGESEQPHQRTASAQSLEELTASAAASPDVTVTCCARASPVRGRPASLFPRTPLPQPAIRRRASDVSPIRQSGAKP